MQLPLGYIGNMPFCLHAVSWQLGTLWDSFLPQRVDSNWLFSGRNTSLRSAGFTSGMLAALALAYSIFRMQVLIAHR
jgi:hypothetical protein